MQKSMVSHSNFFLLSIKKKLIFDLLKTFCLKVIKEFKLDAKVIGIYPGPIVTLYELEPAPGIQTKKIIE